jgi:hypothetical protein
MNSLFLNPTWVAGGKFTFATALAGLTLAFGLFSAGLLSAQSIGGGQFTLRGGPVTGGGQSGGGVFAVAGAPADATSAPLKGGTFEVTGSLIGVAVVPGDVALEYVTTEGQVTLTWPDDGVAYVLEFTSDFSEFAEWQPVIPAPTGTTFTTPFNQPLRFFRLRKP